MTQMLRVWSVTYSTYLSVTQGVRGMVNLSTDNTLKGDQEEKRRINKSGKFTSYLPQDTML